MTAGPPESIDGSSSVLKLAREIISHAGVGSSSSLSRIEIGFSNNVFSIGNDHVLKIGKSPGDQPALAKEAYLCNLFTRYAIEICAPEVVMADTSMTQFELPYIIYTKLPGENLYTRWHEYSDRQRQDVVGQICDILRAINSVPYKDYAATFTINTKTTWHDRMCSRITERRDMVAQRGILSSTVLEQIEEWVEHHHDSLQEETLALTFFDPHFDNFLVRNGQITGALDFERTDVASIDYVLDVIVRMVRYPKKYVCEQYEHLIVDADYAHLLEWFRKYYPEVFAFDRLEERLTMYLIEHSLSDIYYFPEHPTAQAELIHLLSGDFPLRL